MRMNLLLQTGEANLDPEHFPDEELFEWLAQPRNPVLASNDPVVTQFIAAMLNGKPIQFRYTGGSDPWRPRTVSVAMVFQHEPAGPIYVAGYCHERGANRVYSIERVVSSRTWN